MGSISTSKKTSAPFRIPLIVIRDKQVFRPDMLSLMGKPIDVVKRMKEDGYQLIHIVDLDAKKGISMNLDIYDKLTYFINVEVECAPNDAIIKKLLSLGCRIVLEQAPPPNFSLLREKKLLVAKIENPLSGESSIDLTNFNDVIIVHADDKSLERILSLKKRAIVFESEYEKLSPGSKKLVWGIILSSSF